MKHMEIKRMNALIDAAINEFNHKTFSKASLNAILKEAGISKGSFYYNFKNKADLYVYIFELLLEIDQESFDHVMLTSDEAKFSFADIMIRTVDESLKFYQEHPNYYLFFKNAISEPDVEVNMRIQAIQKLIIDELMIPLFIVPGIEEGALKSDFSIEFYSVLLESLFKETAMNLIVIKENKTINEALTASNIKSYLRFFMDGIKCHS